ncbi:MAG TPA: hypothetical protein VHX36_06625 [Candidatus Acidoferrales bacterium]|nr:hypothetical protein [Candidatus Acidoferrales bacterium]
MSEPVRLKGLGHTDDRTHLVARGIIGGLGGSGEQNHGYALEAFAALHDGAKIVAGDFFTLNLGNENVGNVYAKEFESFLGRLDDVNSVAVLAEDITHHVGNPNVGFNGENDRLARLVEGLGARRCALMGRVTPFLFADGVSLGGNELNGEREFAFMRRHANDLGGLGLIQGSRTSGKRERDIEHLALHVARVRGHEKKTIARNINRGADFLEASRRICELDAELSTDFGATTPTALNASWAGIC